jgi:anthranilate synthase/aminodeoxychorismate synthase-like glutamine amidotransferase
MIAVIDNYDSFTYNIVQYLGKLGAQIRVFRNDAIGPGELAALGPSHIVISPGPGTPSEAGNSEAIIRELGPSIPLLGVCLGHQAIGEVFGGVVSRAAKLMHGKTSEVSHDGRGIFADLPNPLVATRYHSLVVETPLPDCLEACATSGDGELMALRHRDYPIHGVQFHPESILTESGLDMLRNFLVIRR